MDMAMLPIGPEHVAARNRLIYHNNTFVPLPNSKCSKLSSNLVVNEAKLFTDTRSSRS